jgi:polysaccharide biosynthesis/export protein
MIRMTYKMLPAILGFIVLSCAPAVLSAQRVDARATERDLERALGEAQADDSHDDLDRPTRRRPSLLDAPISRTEYRLGPGDVMVLSLVGGIQRQFTLVVTPEGTLVVPGMGIVQALDMNIEQAQGRVQRLVGSYYRDTQAYLTLVEVRTFKVYLLGSTASPGMRVASAGTRVSELVPEDAGRNIILRRAAGDSMAVDIRRFLQFGDLSHNPLLREGDVLIVPPVDENIQVHGLVVFPGVYGYMKGESLRDLLVLANGGRNFPSGAADTIHVTRFMDSQRKETLSFARADALGAGGQRFMLEPFDAVFIPSRSNFKELKTATVTGQVLHPGIYPVEPGITRVCELVEMAGGFTSDASLLRSTLRRARDASGPLTGWTQLEQVPPELLSEADRRILRTRVQGDETNVVIDFADVSAGGADACYQTVQANDELIVPRNRDEVVILGAVAQPGVVRHTSSMRVDDLVARAGGFTRRADRGEMVVLRSKLGTRMDAREVPVLEPGDMVIVPFREPRNWSNTIWVASSAVTSVAGLVLTVFAAMR